MTIVAMIREDIVLPENKKVALLLSQCPAGDAERLARFLVEGNHAACVNIVPQVSSVYRWQGKIEQAAECMLIIKCPREKAAMVSALLVKEHPNDLPEVLVVDVVGGNPAYLDWVRESVKGR